ncbi:MAG: hypothetical protein V4659_09740 [Pseudomonadota bacterium]
MSVALALALAAAQDNLDGAFGWRCSAAFAVDGYSGGLWRDYGADAHDAPYMIDVSRTFSRSAGHVLRALSVRPPAETARHIIMWAIDPRPGGPPLTTKPDFLAGRVLADAFRLGPTYVSVDFPFETALVGPLWAHYWGDGAYAGAETLYTARAARKARNRDGRTVGISAGLLSRPILAKLADTTEWTVSARDPAGREITFERFAVPRWQNVESEFRRLRALMDALELEFRTTHAPLKRGGVSCADHGDPAGEI